MIMETVNRGILDYVPEWHMGKERWKEFHAEVLILGSTSH